MSPLAHFTNIHTATSYIEPVYKNLAEAEFFEENKLEKIPLFTEQLYKIDDNKMYFNFNWDTKNREIIPDLKKIVDFIKNKTLLTVLVSFHDKEGLVLYKSKLEGFTFTKIVNDLNYEWNESDIKDLIVEYSFKNKEILT